MHCNLKFYRFFSMKGLFFVILMGFTWETQELSNGARGLRVDWLYIKVRYIVSLRITLYLNSLYHNRIDTFFSHCIEIFLHCIEIFLGELIFPLRRVVSIQPWGKQACDSPPRKGYEGRKKIKIVSVCILLYYKTMYPDGKIPKNTVSENTTRYNAIRLDT